MRKIKSFEESSQEFKDLVSRVEEIDVEAANYLRTEAFSLLEEHFDPCEKLRHALIFRETPQGQGYWWNIAEQLGEV